MAIEKRRLPFILMLAFAFVFLLPPAPRADEATNIGVARLGPLEYTSGPWTARKKSRVAAKKAATDLGVAQLARAEFDASPETTPPTRVLAARRTIDCGGVEIDEAVFLDLKQRVRQRLDAWKGPWHRNECLAAAGDRTRPINR